MSTKAIINLLFVFRAVGWFLILFSAFVSIKLIRYHPIRYKPLFLILVNLVYLALFIIFFNYDFGNPPQSIPGWFVGLFICDVLIAVVVTILRKKYPYPEDEE